MRFYSQLFFSFLKIGAFTLGGGYAMIPLIRQEVVERKRWIKDEEFLNMIALSQSVPGVMAVNAAFFTGYKLRGMKGAVVAVLGSILPSFLIILLIASVFVRYHHLPAVEAVMKGIRPAVVALIAAPLYKMAKSAGLMQRKSAGQPVKNVVFSWLLLLIPISAALLIWLADISPVWIILVTIVASLSIVWLKERRVRK